MTKGCRIAGAALALSVGLGSMAEAGNGSNYVHLLNGLDYFFLGAPPTGLIKGIWRCFPGENLLSPTLVTDTVNPAVGTYAAKVCAIHMTVFASGGGPILFPTIAISTSDGKCHFTRSGGTALNFGLVSTGFGAVIAGPLSGNTGPANVTLQIVILGASFTNPGTSLALPAQLALNLNQLAGSPSSIPVPEGEAMTLWLQENPGQTGQGNRMYWVGSLDERNICSGYSFLLSGTGNAFAFNPAWEWSAGIGTLDATLTPAITSIGGGPSSLNAHAGTAFSTPFDQGTGTHNISITGTTAFPSTSSAGEFLGFAHYDERNAFGGSNKLIVMNLAGFETTQSATCSDRIATFQSLPTGGPGGPALTQLGNKPRSVAKCDALAMSLLGNPVWLAATTHSGVAGGSNVPWFPGGGPISGSTGNTGGFVIPLPANAPQLVGVQLYCSGISLNGTGTAVAPLANNGHSHTNGHAILLHP